MMYKLRAPELSQQFITAPLFERKETVSSVALLHEAVISQAVSPHPNDFDNFPANADSEWVVLSPVRDLMSGLERVFVSRYESIRPWRLAIGGIVEASLERHTAWENLRGETKPTQADRGSSSACCRRHRHDYTTIQVSDSVHFVFSQLCSIRVEASNIPFPGREIRC
jgi:hypothetical protein